MFIVGNAKKIVLFSLLLSLYVSLYSIVWCASVSVCVCVVLLYLFGIG